MNLQETIIQLNELKLRGMSSSFEAMTSLPVQNRPSLEVAISKMVDAEVQDRRDRKTAMYLKISKLRYTALLEDVICGADRNTLASPNEFRQVGVECMMRESCHLCPASRTTIVTASQRDAEHFGSLYRIFAISFVEVTTTEKQQCFGVLGFHLEELSHHRRKTFIIVCHSYLSFSMLGKQKYKILTKGKLP